MQKITLYLMLLILSNHIQAQLAKDTVEIKELLQKEAATWRASDIAAHAECWVIKPYSRILVSTFDGKCYDVPPINTVSPPSGKLGNGGYAVMSNFTFSVQKKHAWVSHDEISFAVDGSKSYSHEIRMLEKIKGKWKLVGQSIHLYKPE